MANEITEQDRRAAEDFGTTPEHEAARRAAQERMDAAWKAFDAYVHQPEHDIRSDEFKSLEKAYLDAEAARDALASVVEPEVDPDGIRALRGEAAKAGDLAQVAVCDRALEGDGAALRECARVSGRARRPGS